MCRFTCAVSHASHEGGLVEVVEEGVLEGALGRQPRLGVVRQQLLLIGGRQRRGRDKKGGPINSSGGDSVSCVAGWGATLALTVCTGTHVCGLVAPNVWDHVHRPKLPGVVGV